MADVKARIDQGTNGSLAAAVKAACLLVGLSLGGSATEARAANRAIFCDGVDDLAIASFTPPIYTNTLTVELWARPEAFNTFGSIASASHAFGAFGMQLDGAQAEAGFMISPGLTTSAFGGEVVLGEWVHLAGTYDGTNVRTFVNGVPVASAIKEDNAELVMSAFKMCVWPLGGYHYRGALDELRIWDSVRTDQQIASFHDVSLTGNEPGLLAYYRFDDLSQGVFDDSGNLRTGTLGADASVADDDPLRIEPGAPVPEPSGAAFVALLTLAGLACSRTMRSGSDSQPPRSWSRRPA